MIDGAGAIVAAYAYDPFGNVTEMAGAEAAENEWRFSTKPVEAGTGWLYYGYRWYDAAMGRWVNRDPISSLGTRAWFVRLTERHNLRRIIFESALRLKRGVGSFSEFQTRKAELSTLTSRGVAELLSFDDYLFVENNAVRLVDILGLSPLTLLEAAVIADRVVAPMIGCVCGVTTDVMFSGNYAFCNEIGKGGTIEEAGNAAYNAIVGLTGKQISKDCALGGLSSIAAMFFPSASMATLWGGGIATLGALPVGCAMGYFDL